MKKIAKGYWIAAGLLLCWAAADLYHYAAIGRDLIAEYNGSAAIRRLVYGSLLQGGGKALLGGMVLLIGWRRGKKGAPVTAAAAVTALLALAAAGTWGASLYCATSVAAEFAAARYLAAYEDFAATLAARSFSHWLGRGYDQKYANYDANRMWEAADDGGRADTFRTVRAAAAGDSGFLDLPDSDRVYSAAAVYDGEGNLLACSWEDYFYFEYLTEEQWVNREERSGNSARAPFDRSLLTEAGREMVEDGDLAFDAQALRFTGSFDGLNFTPRTIEAVGWDAFEEALSAKGSGTYTVSGLVEDSGLSWIPLYEDPEAAPGAETVAFYSDWFDVCYYRPSPAFSYDGGLYDGLDTLVAELGPELAAGRQNMIRYEGTDLLIPSVNYCYTLEGETCYTSYYYGEAAYAAGTEELPQVRFYVVSAVYASPWRTAWGELRYVYLLTLLLGAALVLCGRSVIRRRLIDPVERVGEALAKAGAEADWRPSSTRIWKEGRLLEEGFAWSGDAARIQKNEITRLNIALSYAKQAEENRRQMTAHIAHALKTPLAVIHSYAEGLKEHVAEEKRDKYIDVILAEAERTDGMVLEMLDLSRLEAGRVKLARDDFSLIALTRSVFEKLEMAAREKELRITFSFPDDLTVTADESRMAQVVENFAANAVKYSPAGGRVAVTIRRDGGKITFAIENEGAPLSDEALEKVWDAFYRVEEARCGGTGLGLAIAKNIIELHGGRCFARNTAEGVMFGFTL